MTPILRILLDLGCGLGALAGAFLPRRRWGALAALPIERLAIVSGLMTLAGGFAVGVAGFFEFASQAAGGVVDTAIGVAERQLRQATTHDITTLDMQGVSMFSPFAFLFFTPLGLFSMYLVVSALVRVVAAWADDPVGDPILTGVDALVTRAAGSVSRTRARRSREREEGPEVADRLLRADSAGVRGFDYVLVASRRKPDWSAGTFVITDDKWYTLGEAFEVQLAAGLRTVYPLKEQKTTEVLRRGVQYELPPLEQGCLPARRDGTPRGENV